jgi:hypothetical protein
MIRFTLLLAALFLTLNVSHAQSHEDLKGPAAKNYKPWKQQARNGVLLVNMEAADSKGPAYKNEKHRVKNVKKTEAATNLRKRERITGPKAKNRKAWESE